MQFDFAAILVALTFFTGIVWGLDRLFFAKRRAQSVPASEIVREPLLVEYSRSFFPVILIVLLFRSFIAEPFRIPSGSMMPTLLVGDFILVNKFAYGLRLPVLDRKFLQVGEPQRGDVFVFRYPGFACEGRNERSERPCGEPFVPLTRQDYIKRVIGLPGDEITYRNKTLYVNGQEVPRTYLQAYASSAENGWDGKVSGRLGTADAEDMRMVRGNAEVHVEHLAGLDHRVMELPGFQGAPDGSWTVPPGHYFAMGDNRDNSADSRVWGFVPEENLVGKALLVWMSFRDLRRIGTLIK